MNDDFGDSPCVPWTPEQIAELGRQWNRIETMMRSDTMSTKLGSKVVDIATGTTGVATARCEYFKGTARILVEFAVDSDGKVRQPTWYEEGRISNVPEEPAPTNVTPIAA